MSKFEVGMHVISMPSKTSCVIQRIGPSPMYPIVVHDLDGDFEGSYTREGFRFLDTSSEDRKYHIVIDHSTGNAKQNTNYWTIVRANSAFVQLSHPELQDMIIPIYTIEGITLINNEPTLVSNNYHLCLGPISIQSVADALFTNEINSI